MLTFFLFIALTAVVAVATWAWLATFWPVVPSGLSTSRPAS